jgi:hypothetical protein
VHHQASTTRYEMAFSRHRKETQVFLRAFLHLKLL